MTKTEEFDATPLSVDETRTLSILADMIIPASDEYGAPSAGDAAIVEAILTDSERKRPRLIAALSTLEGLSREAHDVGFGDLSDEQRDGIVASFRDEHGRAADMIAALTVQCYYRDDRVMISLGMEPRPPHPDGYVVDQGDWSLLDQVRRRDEFFRKPD
ncbi:MAG: gluconate 2-dehydrogenase subunit 3 family protein [Alphaproteobacteria bacterium]|nr:gluconate 2-dehydrogenase subunit 3 family protein [Alphaproteobacteria bacterium]